METLKQALRSIPTYVLVCAPMLCIGIYAALRLSSLLETLR